MPRLLNGHPLRAWLRDHGHGDAELLDAGGEVSPEPLRGPFGQRGDDDVVEVTIGDRALDRLKRVRATDETLDVRRAMTGCALSGTPQRPHALVERPIGRLL